jgi:hypothetical protein
MCAWNPKIEDTAGNLKHALNACDESMTMTEGPQVIRGEGKLA